MNGWLIGLCIVLWFLVTHAFFTRVYFSNMMGVFKNLSEFLGEVAGIPEDKVAEMRKTWDETIRKTKGSLTIVSLWWLGITVFLLALAIRGRL